MDLSIKRFEKLEKNIANKKRPPASIPGYVSEWTDKYFHQSVFDVPVKYPSKKVIGFLAQFKKPQKVKLCRGINCYNRDNQQITSWTYNLEIAKRYAKELNGKILSKEFLLAQILLDTTLLNHEQKRQIGYDWKVDDKEVLILTSC